MYLAAGGSAWNAMSCREFKENFEPVDSRDILERVAAMPVMEYNLRTQDDSIRHIGPVAQDFGTFGYGEYPEQAINLEDATGVSLAAIQGLYQLAKDQQAQLRQQQEEIRLLREQVEELRR